MSGKIDIDHSDGPTGSSASDTLKVSGTPRGTVALITSPGSPVSLIESQLRDGRDRNPYQLVPVLYHMGTIKLPDDVTENGSLWSVGLWDDAFSEDADGPRW